MSLFAIVMTAMTALAQTERVPVDVSTERLASGIVAAVEADRSPPLGGSPEFEAVLIAEWQWQETRFGWSWNGSQMVYRPCRSGDHGLSWGPLQLQRVARETACDPEEAAVLWLTRAHDSVSMCGASYVAPDVDAELSRLASGSCWRGRSLSRSRMRAARELLRQIKSDLDAGED